MHLERSLDRIKAFLNDHDTTLIILAMLTLLFLMSLLLAESAY